MRLVKMAKYKDEVMTYVIPIIKDKKVLDVGCVGYSKEDKIKYYTW